MAAAIDEMNASNTDMDLQDLNLALAISGVNPISNEDDERGDAFSFCKASDKKEWKEGFAGSCLYAAFPHIYFPGCRKAVQRLIRAARAFHKEREA